MWRDGANPPGITRQGDKFVGWRPFRQVLFALVKDGGVCRVTVSRSKVPLIRWCWSSPPAVPTATKEVGDSGSAMVAPQTLPPPEKTRDTQEAMRRRSDERAARIQAYDPLGSYVCTIDNTTQKDMDEAVTAMLKTDAVESPQEEDANTEE